MSFLVKHRTLIARYLIITVAVQLLIEFLPLTPVVAGVFKYVPFVDEGFVLGSIALKPAIKLVKRFIHAI